MVRPLRKDIKLVTDAPKYQYNCFFNKTKPRYLGRYYIYTAWTNVNDLDYELIMLIYN